MITGGEHLARILAVLPGLEPVTVPLPEALGRSLRADVTATIDLPGFDNSAMDGYAVRAADLAGATPDRPVSLSVGGDIAAGASPAGLVVRAGACLRIMTGAPMPEGADAVVAVEDTDGGTDVVRVQVPVNPGAHLRYRGDDVRSGDRVLTGDGTRLGPGHLALAAAAGADALTVAGTPRVAVLSTGDELVAVGRRPGPGQIVDSNSLMLAALVRAAGADVVLQRSVVDDHAALEAALEEAAGTADLVLTTGGVSMGAYDTVKEVLSAGGRAEFVKVAMRPGMPQGFGRVGPQDTPIITLPGNPVSALVSFHVFVLPALAALAGAPVDAADWPDPLHRGRPAEAGEAWASADGKVELARVVVADGRLHRSGGQGSHMLGALTAATHLAVVPADRVKVAEGDRLLCLPLLGTGPR